MATEKTKKSFSLDDLDATAKCGGAFEFEYITKDGEETGIFLSVLGSQSEIVTAEVARMVNENRRKEAARAVNQKIGVGQKTVDFEPMENDIEFGKRLAAIRLVGWRGIDDPFTPENALRLCRSNREISAQIIQQSEEMGNFIKL